MKGGLSSIRKNRIFWLIVLLILVTLYYSNYMFSVIPPQTGWMQDIAQRITSGEMIYRDFYWYTPPYFPWLTALFYSIFGNHMVLYTIVGFLISRVAQCILVFSILSRYAKPHYCALAILFGVAINSTYWVEQLFDANPFIMTITLLQAYILVVFFEHPEKKANLLSGLLGILSGMQIMFKQTGIAVLVAVFAILIVGMRLRSNYFGKKTQIILVHAGGIILAILPGVIYLLVHGAFADFVYCIQIAVAAKGGTSGAFDNILYRMLNVDDVILACALFAGSLLLNIDTEESRKRRRFKKASLLVLTLIVIAAFIHRFLPFLSPLFDVLALKDHGKVAIVFTACSVTVLILSLLIYYCRRRKKSTETVYLALAVLCAVLFAIWTRFPEYTLASMYAGVNFSSLRYAVIYIAFYLFVLLWLRDSYLVLLKQCGRVRNEVLSLYVLETVIFAFFAASLMSATIEELYMLPLISILSVRAFKLQVQSDVILALKDTCIIAIVGILIMFSLTQKIIIPYTWHGWQTDALDKHDDPVRSVDVSGLEGMKLSGNEASQYEGIIRTINNFISPADELYEFCNVPLFNVLTNHASRRYVPVAYFDVCPDELAISTAESLADNPPEAVLWGAMDEGTWITHETYFRNGRRSGQREIQEFYSNTVKGGYQLLANYPCDDKFGSAIEIWKRVPVKTAQPDASVGFSGRIVQRVSPISSGSANQLGIRFDTTGTLRDVHILIRDRNGIILSETKYEQLETISGEYVAVDFPPVNLSKDETYSIEFHANQDETSGGSQISITHEMVDANQYAIDSSGSQMDFDYAVFLNSLEVKTE